MISKEGCRKVQAIVEAPLMLSQLVLKLSCHSVLKNCSEHAIVYAKRNLSAAVTVSYRTLMKKL